eukprot:4313256-Pleurochrysis_carterae.AAC.2
MHPLGKPRTRKHLLRAEDPCAPAPASRRGSSSQPRVRSARPGALGAERAAMPPTPLACRTARAKTPRCHTHPARARARHAHAS